MPIKIKYIDSIGDYYDNIINIEKEIYERKYKNRKELITRDRDKPSTLWFRAESNFKYTLIPSLFRDNRGVEIFDTNEQYSNMHYAEDIRTQHYSAKNYHYFVKDPSSRIEWLEVMQHHGVKTRVLDWSESSTHSLLFALECFYNNKPIDNNCNITPCVWVLDPQGLNKELLQCLGNDKNEILQKSLLKNLNLNSKEVDKIIERIVKFSSEETIESYMEQEDIYHINYLVNLSAICSEFSRNSVWLERMLLNGEAINPLFYLLMRIYSDGYVLDSYELPPLAVTHPYHSERIKAQKGVFTVFPFYREMSTDKRKLLKDICVNPDSMSFNAIVQKHLYKLIIRRPQKIAYEILANGMNESWIYPEMPIVSSEIESHKIC